MHGRQGWSRQSAEHDFGSERQGSQHHYRLTAQHACPAAPACEERQSQGAPKQCQAALLPEPVDEWDGPPLIMSKCLPQRPAASAKLRHAAATCNQNIAHAVYAALRNFNSQQGLEQRNNSTCRLTVITRTLI